VAADDPLTLAELQALGEYDAALRECAAEGNASPEWCELYGRVDGPRQSSSESWRVAVARALRRAGRPKHSARSAWKPRSAVPLAELAGRRDD